jgi:hypothetical protein|tara:strand:- start:4599 stop:5249 length:651 start_codon:yes stop_codon:yes gene_type:complete
MAWVKQLKEFLSHKDNEKYDIFIETGFLKGQTLHNASKLKRETGDETGEYVFKKLYSLELHEEYFTEALSLQRPNIKALVESGRAILVPGDSAVTMPQVLENITDPSMFYLDAHGHNDVGQEVPNNPLFKELEAIAAHHIKGHLIVIDDVGFIEHAVENPDRAPWATLTGGIDKLKEYIEHVFGKPIKFEKIMYPSRNEYSPLPGVKTNYFLTFKS